ncbi:hypothetical protein N6H18_02085 [Reichenbachiella agarivorans]|uniref:Tetratricopeptide repeat-containing protein n=1 Tax=Reichenbachiella agarivorans TaxID=2979464 RepID=A0ABY6CQF2_9BACT|nr:hypothetical protein [Reichenbachiella agarivorans]UXP32752.1 hypothetical protein N6H18_02085 [Reichenbachiella agarivorans]
MSKEGKGNVERTNINESLKALYFSGKVKPTLNKIVVELKSDPDNIELVLLGCQCLARSKDYDQLEAFADESIRLDNKTADGYYYKGLALHHSKGKEQEALINFNEALTLDPESTSYLIAKANTHLLLFTDYHLPIKFAEKHRDKGEACLTKIISLVEEKENPSYKDLLNMGDVYMTLSRNLDAKKYYIHAMNAYETSEESNKDKNIYKDIVKGSNKV